jgi:thiosulfate dehydrogenase [quinone] large subunit
LQLMPVVCRLYLGLIFAVACYAKLSAPNGFTAILRTFLNVFVMQNGFTWYKQLVSAIVLPHVNLFASLVVAGELFVAIGMILGIATRAAATVAIVLLVNYLCAKGLPPWSPASNDVPDILLAVLVIVSAAGRRFGVDQILHERFPRVFIW